ncbi:hypothetical protein CRUP_012799 [Coryphaenoides rupestris]|nr:hypothetical protein CRUP_012799 [Coryphaenoides rupestris]
MKSQCQSLLLSNGDEWSRRRRLLTSAFHVDVLKGYVAVFNTSANTMHAKWMRLLGAGEGPQEMFHHLSLMTLDSLLKCAFSHDSCCQERSSEYVSAIQELGELIMARRRTLLHHWDWLYWRSAQGTRFLRAARVVHSFTRAVVEQRRALIRQRRDEKAEAESGDEEADAICWALYNLARHAHFQERCRQEVMELMQDQAESEITADLASLPFTTMCIRESLRLHSPVLAVTRHIYGTHHNPTVWTDPLEFDPLRFDPAHTRGRSPYAFIPFSSGPRNCIGQRFAMAELQVVVAMTLLRFRLSPGANPASDPGATSAGPGIRRLPQLVLRAEGGMWLRLERLAPPPSPPGPAEPHGTSV